MSNDLVTMFSGSVMAPIEGLDDDTLAVAGGARQNKRILIKGGVFRKYAGGKEIGAIEDLLHECDLRQDGTQSISYVLRRRLPRRSEGQPCMLVYRFGDT